MIELLAGATLVDGEFAAELRLDPGMLPSALEVAPAGVDADEVVVVPLLPQAVSASSAALTAVPYTRLLGGRLLWNAIC